MQDVYERCPTFENDQYRIRLLSKEDAADLLNVYSDEKTISLCNSDNCSGGFHFTTMDVMRDVIKWWQEEYARRGFVRFFTHGIVSGKSLYHPQKHRNRNLLQTACNRPL